MKVSYSHVFYGDLGEVTIKVCDYVKRECSDDDTLSARVSWRRASKNYSVRGAWVATVVIEAKPFVEVRS